MTTFSQKLQAVFVAACSCMAAGTAFSQSQLYPTLFDLSEVRLTDSLFLHAEELNYDVLMQYDVDRLLTPFMRQAGFTEWEEEHPNFANWGSGSFRLDGHVGGHYLTALALAYASSHDEQRRAQFKQRLDYMIDKLAECQDAFDDNTDGLRGYIGGLPDNDVWTHMASGNLDLYNRNRGNVPLYTMHKVYAGLRDAYLYAGSEKALAMFYRLCDWGIALTEKLDSAAMQSVLHTEHGGINEVYADAYALSGNPKYLRAAHRFTHQTMVDGMQTSDPDFLSGKHANTQVPKYIGFIRTAQTDTADSEHRNAQLRLAAQNFWTDVVHNRTTAIGGNSVGEHFLATSQGLRHVTDTEGPESCNTNNMLKLTEDLAADHLTAELADFYESAMLNHILSTQHPTTGGYVYFTSLRPQHYRIYSQVNQGMWCCVGTGMENHSKYGEFVYSRSLDRGTLFVNLFVSSRLDNEKFSIAQSTRFPYEEGTTIMVNRDSEFTLAVRQPSWCTAPAYSLNGRTLEPTTVTDGYAHFTRRWKKGDQLRVSLPMQLSLVECPGAPSYIAFRYGPVLLAAKTSTDDLDGLFAGEGRMDHSPIFGPQRSLASAPMLIGERSEVLSHVRPVDLAQLLFQIDAELYNDTTFARLRLQPFYSLHEARYMVYWNQLTQAQWDTLHTQLEAEAAAAQRLNDRTLDYIGTGEQQSDAGHSLTGSFEKGVYLGEHYIHARPGSSFTYRLSTQGHRKGLSLMCRYSSTDARRHFTILVNGHELEHVTLQPQAEHGLYTVEYALPTSMIDGEEIEVTFKAPSDSFAGGIYGIWLLE